MSQTSQNIPDHPIQITSEMMGLFFFQQVLAFIRLGIIPSLEEGRSILTELVENEDLWKRWEKAAKIPPELLELAERHLNSSRQVT